MAKIDDYGACHQLHPGPKRYGTIAEVAIEYVNHLEERVNMLERELMASHERERWHESQGAPDVMAVAKAEAKMHAPEPVGLWDQMEAVRAKNTALEAERIELKNAIEGLKLTMEAFAKNNDTLKEELRKIKEQNATLINERRGRSLRDFTEAAGAWTRDTFDDVVWRNAEERACRLIEEALEVGQKWVSRDRLHKIEDQVYSKPIGELKQELGGVLVCWGAMVSAFNFDPQEIASKAIDDCWNRQGKIREKYLLKLEAGTSVKIEDPMKGHDDDADHRTMRMVPRYSDAPLTSEQRSAQIIDEGQANLRRHIEDTRDPH